MSRKWICRACFALFALLFLIIHICVPFSAAVHAKSCANACALCLHLAKLQENLQHFGGAAGTSAALLALLPLLWLIAFTPTDQQNKRTLVTLRMRLNR